MISWQNTLRWYNMEVIAIFAVDDSNGMGKNGTIPWHVREDFLHFKMTTMDNVVIMGAKTYYDLRDNYTKNGVVLPGRIIRVISRKDGDGNIYFDNDLEVLFKELKQHGTNKCYIIGGAQILYHAFNNHLVSSVIISRIKGDYNCDVVLPLDFSDTEKVRIENCSFNITQVVSNNQFDIVYANTELNNNEK